MPPSLLKISNAFLRDPQTIDVLSGGESRADIEQAYYQVSHAKKQDVLTLLMHANEQRCMIFCNTKMMVDELTEMLRKQGFKVAGLHGDMTQAARSQVMKRFRDGSVHALVATDVAARGIDVDNIDVVINYDLPQTFEYYVHRIGRTGRAGNRGLSQTLVSGGKQHAVLRSLIKYTGHEISERKLPTSAEIMDTVVARTVLQVEEHLGGESGRAAQKLVASLLDNDAFGGSAREVAVALAEVLIGGDELFDRLKGVEETARAAKKGGRGERESRGHSARGSQKSRGQKTSHGGGRSSHRAGDHDGNRGDSNTGGDGSTRQRSRSQKPGGGSQRSHGQKSTHSNHSGQRSRKQKAAHGDGNRRG
jgi:ATP-dependent RNA helicase DeaD